MTGWRLAWKALPAVAAVAAVVAVPASAPLRVMTVTAAAPAPAPAVATQSPVVTTVPLAPGADVIPLAPAEGLVSVTGPGADNRLAALQALELIDVRITPMGIPAIVLHSYRSAARTIAHTDPGCHIEWQVLAGIGLIESGQAGGGPFTADGTRVPPILGPVLDGTNGTAAIHDTDGGRYDGSKQWDRAVGPMQFLPSTWAHWGADANHDGVADPNNVFDASLAAGDYLCAAGGDLSKPSGLVDAIYAYNHADWYVLEVVRAINGYLKFGARPGLTVTVAALKSAHHRNRHRPAATSGNPAPGPTPSPSASQPSASPTASPTTSPSPSPTSGSPSPSPSCSSSSPTPSPTTGPTKSPIPVPTPVTPLDKGDSATLPSDGDSASSEPTPVAATSSATATASASPSATATPTPSPQPSC